MIKFLLGINIVIITCLISGCENRATKAPNLSQLLEKPPLVAVWRKFHSTLSVEDSLALRAAIWADGTVIFNSDPTIWDNKLHYGRLDNNQIKQIKQKIAATELFELTGTTYLVPSAEVICIMAKFDNKQQILYWDEIEKSNYGININPQPHHLKFIKTWKDLNNIVITNLPQPTGKILQPFQPPKSWYLKPAIQSE